MIFSVHNIYLLCKYTLESAYLAICLLLLFPKGKRHIANTVFGVVLACLVSGAAQIALHILFNLFSAAQQTFIWRYMLMMGLLGLVIHRLFCGGSLRTVFSVIFHFLVSSVLAQFIGTQGVFTFFGYLPIADFDLAQQLISAVFTHTALILLLVFLVSVRKKIPLLVGRQCLLSDVLSAAIVALAVLFNEFFCYNTTYRVVAILLLLGLFCLQNVMLFLLLQIASERQQKFESLQLGQQYELRLQQVRELDSVYDDLRSLRHEYKNHAAYLKFLLDNKNYEEMDEYLSKLSEQTDGSCRFFDTGNRLIDAVLSSKVGYAETLGIPVRVSASLPAELAVDGGSILCVLSNLLDNAVEASLNEPEKEITLRLLLQNNYLVFVVKNKSACNILLGNPELRSSKKDAERHGYGIKNVRRILHKYGGMIDFSYEDGCFTVTATMQNRSAEKQ